MCWNLCKLCIIYAILCIFWIYSQYSMNVSSKQAMIPGDPDRGRTGDLLRDREACWPLHHGACSLSIISVGRDFPSGGRGKWELVDYRTIIDKPDWIPPRLWRGRMTEGGKSSTWARMTVIKTTAHSWHFLYDGANTIRSSYDQSYICYCPSTGSLRY